MYAAVVGGVLEPWLHVFDTLILEGQADGRRRISVGGGIGGSFVRGGRVSLCPRRCKHAAKVRTNWLRRRWGGRRCRRWGSGGGASVLAVCAQRGHGQMSHGGVVAAHQPHQRHCAERRIARPHALAVAVHAVACLQPLPPVGVALLIAREVGEEVVALLVANAHPARARPGAAIQAEDE